MILLSIRFHISLLKVSSKPMKVLIIRQQSVGFCAIKIVIPDPQQGQNDWCLGKKPQNYYKDYIYNQLLTPNVYQKLFLWIKKLWFYAHNQLTEVWSDSFTLTTKFQKLTLCEQSMYCKPLKSNANFLSPCSKLNEIN